MIITGPAVPLGIHGYYTWVRNCFLATSSACSTKMLFDSRRVFLNTQKIEQAKESFCWLGWDSPFSLLLTMFWETWGYIAFFGYGERHLHSDQRTRYYQGSMRVFSRFLWLQNIVMQTQGRVYKCLHIDCAYFRHAADSRTVTTAIQAYTACLFWDAHHWASSELHFQWNVK